MKGEERQRLARLLSRDKAEITPATQEALQRDLQRVAAEYFETDGEVKVIVSPEKNGYAVTLGFHALRVKNFTTLQ